MSPGQVVYSKSGRDKGRPFVVVSVEGEYVYLTDGQIRPINKPKKKKARHVQPTNTVLASDVGKMMDSDIRKWLLPWVKK